MFQQFRTLEVLINWGKRKLSSKPIKSRKQTIGIRNRKIKSENKKRKNNKQIEFLRLKMYRQYLSFISKNVKLSDLMINHFKRYQECKCRSGFVTPLEYRGWRNDRFRYYKFLPSFKVGNDARNVHCQTFYFYNVPFTSRLFYVASSFGLFRRQGKILMGLRREKSVEIVFTVFHKSMATK